MMWGSALAMEEGFNAPKSKEEPEEKISSSTRGGTVYNTQPSPQAQNVLDAIAIIEGEYVGKQYQKAASLLFDAIRNKDLLKHVERDLGDEKRKKVDNLITCLKKSHKRTIKDCITDIEQCNKKYRGELNRPKIEEIKENLKLVNTFYDKIVALRKLQVVDPKNNKVAYEQRTNKFESLVKEMNKEQFFIEKIFFGTPTSVQGNNSVLEQGMFDRLRTTKTSLEKELDKLVGLEKKQ